MPPRWALALYNGLEPFLFAAWVPFFLPRILRRGGVRSGAGQRFGLFDAAARARLSGSGGVWIHAVSVGEVVIAIRLLEALRRREKDLRVVLSTTSTTGLALARRRVPDIPAFFAPLDFRFAVRRALDLVAPRDLVLVEEEIWPNLIVEAKRRGVRVTVVDARVSDRSEFVLRRLLGKMSRGVFAEVDAVGAPDASEAARWIRLGARPETIVETGRVKFDDEGSCLSSCEGPRAVLRAAGIGDDRPVLLAGSTHRGEEAALARVFLRLRESLPALALVVVPRYAERSRSVLRTLQRMGLHALLRSEAGGPGGTCDAVVVDTTGELRDWYGVATVVFVGKSLCRSGGQNPMEPVAAGRPVLFGPRMGNFAAVARKLLDAGGARETADEVALLDACGTLLADPAAREEMARRGRLVLDGYRGATERAVELVLAGRL